MCTVLSASTGFCKQLNITTDALAILFSQVDTYVNTKRISSTSESISGPPYNKDLMSWRQEVFKMVEMQCVLI
jgi:hypothetical protein